MDFSESLTAQNYGKYFHVTIRYHFSKELQHLNAT